MSKKYSEEIHAGNTDYGISPDYLYRFSTNRLLKMITGIRYAPPEEVILHLEREHMVYLFIGLGVYGEKNWHRFLDRSRSLIEIIQFYIDMGIPNEKKGSIPNLKEIDLYPRRDPRLVYDFSIEPNISTIWAAYLLIYKHGSCKPAIQG